MQECHPSAVFGYFAQKGCDDNVLMISPFVRFPKAWSWILA
ncbi:hypothetical protein M3J09_002663 [Ascochyta lentis]